MNNKLFFMYTILLFSLLSLQGCAADEPEPIEEPINSMSSELLSETGISAASAEADAIPAPIPITEEELAPYFAAFDNATMLISNGSSIVVYNEPLSQIQQSPCSTFKIPNSLIALEEGIISIESSDMHWDGTIYSRPEINQDQDLASAMKTSCVWYYQALARQTGTDTMQNYLEAISYGNKDISGGLDTFWLTSSLLISPKEQLDFIIRFYNDDLPFTPENIDYVKSILYQDQYPIDLYGKTGSSGNGMGWFVGYAIFDDQPFFVSAYGEGTDVSGLVVRETVAQIFSDYRQEFSEE